MAAIDKDAFLSVVWVFLRNAYDNAPLEAFDLAELRGALVQRYAVPASWPDAAIAKLSRDGVVVVAPMRKSKSSYDRYGERWRDMIRVKAISRLEPKPMTRRGAQEKLL